MKATELINKQSALIKEIIKIAEEIDETMNIDNVDKVRLLGMNWVVGAVKMMNDCTTEFLRIAKPICCLDDVENDVAKDELRRINR